MKPSTGAFIFALFGFIAVATGQPCQPEWAALEGGGLDRNVRALLQASGGLFAGGTFLNAGGLPVNYVARWDPQPGTWSDLAGGMNALVEDLALFDDGGAGGPAVYAGGWFSNAGGVTANGIAKWDGQSWSPLGLGVASPFGPVVYALAVFNDGSGAGPALYVGGPFTSAGGLAASRIAKWNGQSWSALGAGTNSSVNALAVFDDGRGGGPALYAGGTFDTAGGSPAAGIAKWNGQSWSALGAGTVGAIRALVVFDDGGGRALYAGGEFISAGGGVPGTSRVAKWNGTTWSALGTGFDDTVEELAVFNDGAGGGAALYAGGWFAHAGGVEASRIAKWNGQSWSALGSGMDIGTVQDFAVLDDGSGPALYVAGGFTSAGGVPAQRIARWGCPPAPPCTADFDGDGAVNVQDFLAYLAAYAAADPRADITGDGRINVQDFLAFLALFAAGC